MLYFERFLAAQILLGALTVRATRPEVDSQVGLVLARIVENGWLAFPREQSHRNEDRLSLQFCQ